MLPVLVLDTNVWLDLLVFRDPRVASLHAGLRDGHVRCVTDAATRGELGQVLAYPALALDAAARAAALAEADSLSALLPIDGRPRTLPRCSDPDDQMFVELAVAAAPCVLLTRDEALLRMATRLRREGVEVATPAAWCAARDAAV